MPTAAQLAARRRLLVAGSKRPPRPGGRVPPTQRPTALELSFARIARRALGAVDAVLLEGLPPELRADAADGGAGPTPPPLTAKARAGLLRQMEVALRRATTRTALIGDLDALAARTGQFTRAEFARQLKAAVGIDLTADPSLRAEIERFRAAAIAQIKSQGAAKVARIGRVLEDAGSGTRVETIAKRIREETDATPARAALIARDQVLTLSAEMTAARHQAAGIVQYVWRTSQDERVRPEHRALEGQRFAYDDPPVVAKNGDRAHPGVYFQCRCTAEPVIEWGDEEEVLPEKPAVPSRPAPARPPATAPDEPDDGPVTVAARDMPGRPIPKRPASRGR